MHRVFVVTPKGTESFESIYVNKLTYSDFLKINSYDSINSIGFSVSEFRSVEKNALFLMENMKKLHVKLNCNYSRKLQV